MNKYIVWLLYMVYCNVVLFVMCALPWYAVIVISKWYLFLALPLTPFAVITCSEVLYGLENPIDNIED